ncbi:MAG: hypothetical protein JNL14_15250 [Devosia sp.]|nr:hypothetical protein [Devosia sp.]MBL8599088.1 hypothetical protein [Devosia sp.]
MQETRSCPAGDPKLKGMQGDCPANAAPAKFGQSGNGVCARKTTRYDQGSRRYRFTLIVRQEADLPIKPRCRDKRLKGRQRSHSRFLKTGPSRCQFSPERPILCTLDLPDRQAWLVSGRWEQSEINRHGGNSPNVTQANRNEAVGRARSYRWRRQPPHAWASALRQRRTNDPRKVLEAIVHGAYDRAVEKGVRHGRQVRDPAGLLDCPASRRTIAHPVVDHVCIKRLAS